MPRDAGVEATQLHLHKLRLTLLDGELQHGDDFVLCFRREKDGIAVRHRTVQMQVNQPAECGVLFRVDSRAGQPGCRTLSNQTTKRFWLDQQPRAAAPVGLGGRWAERLLFLLLRSVAPLQAFLADEAELTVSHFEDSVHPVMDRVKNIRQSVTIAAHLISHVEQHLLPHDKPLSRRRPLAVEDSVRSHRGEERKKKYVLLREWTGEFVDALNDGHHLSARHRLLCHAPVEGPAACALYVRRWHGWRVFDTHDGQTQHAASPIASLQIDSAVEPLVLVGIWDVDGLAAFVGHAGEADAQRDAQLRANEARRELEGPHVAVLLVDHPDCHSVALQCLTDLLDDCREG
mmetsp:Transcript_53882/g.135397  ORF Transcript_53882/g.135397 Transcript_53882/m.135397 type:complete len:346 (+) Transcript_53882:592-1629(+)